MVRNLVEHGACIFAATITNRETAADKCEEEEDGFKMCSQYLLGQCLLPYRRSQRLKPPPVRVECAMLNFLKKKEGEGEVLWDRFAA